MVEQRLWAVRLRGQQTAELSYETNTVHNYFNTSATAGPVVMLSFYYWNQILETLRLNLNIPFTHWRFTRTCCIYLHCGMNLCVTSSTVIIHNSVCVCKNGCSAHLSLDVSDGCCAPIALRTVQRDPLPPPTQPQHQTTIHRAGGEKVNGASTRIIRLCLVLTWGHGQVYFGRIKSHSRNVDSDFVFFVVLDEKHSLLLNQRWQRQ